MKRKEERLKVYISGPLTDKKTSEVSDENRIAFGRAQCLIKKEGYYDVINPTRVWACRYPWIYRAMERVFGKASHISSCYSMMSSCCCAVAVSIRSQAGARVGERA